MKDKLDRIFELQAELNARTFKDNDCVPDYNRLRELANQTEIGSTDQAMIELWLQNYTRALQQESSELLDCTNWKWWRSKVNKFDLQKARVEIVDCLFFLVSLAQVAGLGAGDVLRLYEKKCAVNHKRQDDGYKVKENDESDII